jgi:crotonobetainyl-CoA:carnitine CoA-transferase CaiB-like acyl-CoA transferase
VRVLDLSRVVAAPLATMLLGDLGATVIKVERPGPGDETRSWGPPFVAGESAYYLALNRHKAGMAVDLAHPEGRRIIEHLATTWADVVVENFRGDALVRLGLDSERLRAANRRLVWARVTGYPPGDDRPGYDFIIQGLSGFMSLNGQAESGPTRAPVAVADLMTGLYLTSGILAALFRRQATGEGGTVTVSLYEAGLALLPNVTQSFLVSGQAPSRHGNAHPQLAPYEVLEAADGPFTVGVGNNRQFRALVAAVGLPSLAEDLRFSDNRSRVEHRLALIEALQPVLRTQPVAHWLEVLDRAEVPAGPIRSVPEALAAEETARSGLVTAVAHPLIGELPQVGNPVWLDGQRLPVRQAPPLLGQHSREVLAAIGYDLKKIRELVADGVVAVADGPGK